MGPLRRVVQFIARHLNPVTDVLPVTKPEPSKPEDLWRCDNARCCGWLPYGLGLCPLCGHRQQRVRSVVVAHAQDQAILDALDPDNPYDWAVHGL